LHQVTDKLYHIMLICIDYTSPKWNSNSQRLCKQRFKTWDLQRWPYWYLVFIITLMPNRNSIYYVIVIVQSIRYMLVILPSLGDPTWAELRRSSGQGSPKLCSITEHIPIRLDNKCFNTWHPYYCQKALCFSYFQSSNQYFQNIQPISSSSEVSAGKPSMLAVC
jgi:hypothetical protein